MYCPHVCVALRMCVFLCLCVHVIPGTVEEYDDSQGALVRHTSLPLSLPLPSSAPLPLSSCQVVIPSCYAIHYLCFTPNNVSWMGANGACEAVTHALNRHIRYDYSH